MLASHVAPSTSENTTPSTHVTDADKGATDIPSDTAWVVASTVAVTVTVAMEDKVALIGRTLAALSRVEFSKLLTGFDEKMHGVMTFLAGLEMTRRREIALRQVEPFSELWIYRQTEGDVVPPDERKASAPEEPEAPRGIKRRPPWMKPEEEEADDPFARLLSDGAVEADAEPEPTTPHTVEPETP